MTPKTSKTLSPWKRLSRKRVLTTPYLSVDKDIVQLPNGKRHEYYQTNLGKRAVMIIAVDAKGSVYVQKEFRYPIRRVIYELPSGIVDPRETPLQAAKRELREEAGLVAQSWKLLGVRYAWPSSSDVSYYFLLAKKLRSVPSKPDSTEWIQGEWVSYARLRKMLKTGTLPGVNSLAAGALYHFFLGK